MTEEQAIKVLCMIETHGGLAFKAKEMAIEALKQKLYDDAISRQAVDTLIDELARAISDERCCISRGRSTATIMQDILDLPSVKPQEPKTGHWITTRTFMHDGEYYCDKCKCESPNNEKWDYCPNCGAKMVEPQESEVNK